MPNGDGHPSPGLLDLLTRTDELLISLIEENRALNAKMSVLIGAPTDGIIIPSAYTLAIDELRRRVLSGEWIPYTTWPEATQDAPTKTQALDTATTDTEIIVEGDSIACWTNGSYAGIGVRFNDKANPIVYFNRANPIHTLPYAKLFISWNAQAGKVMSLFIGRQASADVMAIGGVGGGGAAVSALHTITSDKDTHFYEAINQNATEEENLTGLVANKIRIVGVAIQADQSLDFRCIFFSTDDFANTDLDVDDFIGEVELDIPSYGFQIAGANQYYMVVNGLSIDYTDDDGTNELHIALQNLSSTAKNQTTTGEVRIVVMYEERA